MNLAKGEREQNQAPIRWGVGIEREFPCANPHDAAAILSDFLETPGDILIDALASFGRLVWRRVYEAPGRCASESVPNAGSFPAYCRARRTNRDNKAIVSANAARSSTIVSPCECQRGARVNDAAMDPRPRLRRFPASPDSRHSSSSSWLDTPPFSKTREPTRPLLCWFPHFGCGRCETASAPLSKKTGRGSRTYPSVRPHTYPQ